MPTATISRAAATPRPATSAPVARVIAPELRLADAPAGAILHEVRRHGTITRDVLARRTGVSAATVNRQVNALLDAGLLRERADLTASGAIGRPRVPVEVLHEPYLTLGIHIGARVTSIVASDLRGHGLGCVEIPTPTGDPAEALPRIAASARAYAARWRGRRPLWAGVALGGRVDGRTGVVDHPRLGWTNAPVAAVLSARLGLPVSVAAHVEAMAAAELLLTRGSGAGEGKSRDAAPGGSSLYVYAREMVGTALTIDGRVHTPSGGAGTISHLPTGSEADCDCGRRGCLEATASDRAVVTAAVTRGAIDVRDATASGVAAVHRAAAGGSAEAHGILVERAETLGRATALLRDMLNPDRIILGGQAFTDYAAGIPHVAEAFAEATTLPSTDVHISGFGPRIQQAAAGVTSLSAFYSDPLAAMRKAQVG